MRYLLIISILALSLFAKEEACYSVQLTSYYTNNSGYLRRDDYPESCELMSIANMKAIRCGCFTDRKEAVSELKILKTIYRSSVLVRTYKYRFKNLQEVKTSPKTEPTTDDSVEDTTPVDTIAKDETDQDIKSDETQESDVVPFVKKMQTFIDEGTFEFKGQVNLTTQAYLNRPDGKHKANMTASTKLEAQFRKDDFTAVTTLYGQQDYYDFKGSSDHNDRSFARLDELYGKYDFEDDQVLLGKSTRFWGALELSNIVDGFNVQDLRSDPFKNDKLGAWNAAYTHYTESGEFSVIVKLYEQDRKMSSYPYVYYYFPRDARYDDTLEAEDSRARPSVFLKYTGSTDTEYPLDYSIIFENGYDSQRYFKADSYGSFHENAYIVNKLMTYNTLVVGSTLIKLEAAYADVKSTQTIPTFKGDYKSISDYYHIGLGVEHTLTQFYKDADLGLIAEYYKYGILQSSNEHLNDRELFEALQNDLFLGARYSFNEGNDASIIGGVIVDLDYHEQAYYVEYESRINDTFKLNLDYRYIEPSDDTLTVYRLIQRHQRVSLNLGYYF